MPTHLVSAFHIHISGDIQKALEGLNWGFQMLERGVIEVKVWFLWGGDALFAGHFCSVFKHILNVFLFRGLFIP